MDGSLRASKQVNKEVLPGPVATSGNDTEENSPKSPPTTSGKGKSGAPSKGRAAKQVPKGEEVAGEKQQVQDTTRKSMTKSTLTKSALTRKEDNEEGTVLTACSEALKCRTSKEHPVWGDVVSG